MFEGRLWGLLFVPADCFSFGNSNNADGKVVKQWGVLGAGLDNRFFIYFQTKKYFFHYLEAKTLLFRRGWGGGGSRVGFEKLVLDILKIFSQARKAYWEKKNFLKKKK